MKKILLFACMLFAANIVFAQPPFMPPPGMMGHGHDGNDGKSRYRRLEYLKEKLEMSDEQFDRFAPAYNDYQKDVRNIRKDLKTYMDSFEGKEIDDKVAYKLVMAQLNADADIIRCKKEHIRVFKDYLTPAQLSKIFLIENGRPAGKRPQGEGMPKEGARE